MSFLKGPSVSIFCLQRCHGSSSQRNWFLSGISFTFYLFPPSSAEIFYSQQRLHQLTKDLFSSKMKFELLLSCYPNWNLSWHSCPVEECKILLMAKPALFVDLSKSQKIEQGRGRSRRRYNSFCNYIELLGIKSKSTHVLMCKIGVLCHAYLCFFILGWF